MSTNKYYVKINTENWNRYQLGWLKRKSIVGLIKHKQLGYVIEINEQDAKLYQKTRQISLNIWPDNDSYNFWETFEIDKIFCQKTIIQEL